MRIKAKHAVYLLSVLLLGVACDAPQSSQHQSHPTPTPIPTPIKDFSLFVRYKYVEGVTWDEAKAAIEKQNVKMRALSLFTPENSDFYAAVVLTDANTLEVFAIRPFSTNGTEFIWNAEPLPKDTYQKLLASQQAILQKIE